MSAPASATASTRERLFLNCRRKSCCHTTRVIIAGADLWRIARTLDLAPWRFTRYAEASPDAPDGFLLAPGGPAFQIVLAKRGAVGRQGAPCFFLWRTNDGHAQCGLGGLRPLPCQTYPAVLLGGLLQVDGSACTCRRWSVLDLDGGEVAGLERQLAEAAAYSRIVAAWNAQLVDECTYPQYCVYVLDQYAQQRGEPTWRIPAPPARGGVATTIS